MSVYYDLGRVVGPAGAAGAAATVEVGTVTTGPAGSAAAVENVGTAGAAVLNFTIPRGAAGPQGPAGEGILPGGGTVGQVLTKTADGAAWANPGGGGGGGGGGDMLTSVYDTNNNGVVDNAEALGGQAPSYYAAANTVMARTKIYTASCATAASTAAKVATLDDATDFSLAAGVMVAVRFTNGNSATTPTLNVNSSGAKAIAIPDSVLTYVTGNGTTYNSWGKGETILFTYTGDY